MTPRVRAQIFNRICRIIGHPRANGTLIDKALGVYNALATGAFRKALPVIDTSEQDQRRIELERKQRNQEMSNAPTAKRRVYVATPGKTFAGISITEFSDGSISVKPEQAPPANFNPACNPEQKKELLRMALRSLEAKRKGTEEPPVKAINSTNKGDGTMSDMKKSQEPRRWFQQQRGIYDPLIASSKQPAAHATHPTPLVENRPLWGTMPAVGQLSAHKAYTKAPEPVSGHIAAFARCGGDLSKLPPGTDLTQMNRNQMVDLAQQQAKEQVAPQTAAHSRLYRR